MFFQWNVELIILKIVINQLNRLDLTKFGKIIFCATKP